MPSTRKRGTGPTRRSERLSEPSTSRKSSKRKRDAEDDDSEKESKMIILRSSDGTKIDSYCWICHKAGYQQRCASCPRVYHNRCLKSISSEINSQGICPECLEESVDGTEFGGMTRGFLQDCLICLMLEVFPISPKVFNVDSNTPEKSENSRNKRTLLPVLRQWPQDTHEVTAPMDLEILIDMINRDHYQSTADFYSDVKWMYHNCYKVFGVDSENTIAAKKLQKQIKNELLEMESCCECYYKKKSVEVDDDDDDEENDPFVTLCQNPHRLLWVKLRGYPSWPSKCMKVINNMAHVQFFGTHDRAAVKTNTCFLMSKDNPSGKKLQRTAYQNSVDEMNFYINNYEKKYGPYIYAPAKTVFVPSDEECHVVKKKQETSCNLNTSSEVADDSLNQDEADLFSSQEIEIIDDVEIAESSKDSALCANCELIDVTDEDEDEITTNNSEGVNLEIQSVEKSVTSHHDGIIHYQEFGCPSSRYDIHMLPEAPLEQDTSDITQPPTSQIEVQSLHVNNIPASDLNQPSDSAINVQSSHVDHISTPDIYQPSTSGIIVQSPHVDHIPTSDMPQHSTSGIIVQSPHVDHIPTSDMHQPSTSGIIVQSPHVDHIPTSDIHQPSTSRIIVQSPLVDHIPTSDMHQPATSGIIVQSLHLNCLPASALPCVRNVHLLTDNQEEIHQDSNSRNELLNNSHDSETNDDLEVLYVGRRQKNCNKFTRTDLSTLSHPLIKSIVSEGENYVQDVTKSIVQHAEQIASDAKLVQKLLIAVIDLGAELQAMRERSKRREQEPNRPNRPNITKFLCSLKEESKRKIGERTKEESKRKIAEKTEVIKTITVHQKGFFPSRTKSCDKKKETFGEQGAQTSLCDLESVAEEYFKQRREKQVHLWEKQREKDILSSKTNTWCIRCLQQASIFCCVNAIYCDEQCRMADLAQHAPNCKKT